LLKGEFAGLTEQALLLQTVFYRLFEQETPNLKVVFDIRPNGRYKQPPFAFVNFLSMFLDARA
jgi:hypothetical protein